jgi:hypothetical protein
MTILGDQGRVQFWSPISNKWYAVALMQSWTMNVTSDTIDPTTADQWFSAPEKGRISGSGTMDFWVERAEAKDVIGPDYLMHLALATAEGAKVQCEFWMMDDRPLYACGEQGLTLLPGDFYYKATLILTRSVVNTRTTEFIAGSCDFITHGEIQLLSP